MPIDQANLLMLLLGAATALWCLLLSMALVRSQRGTSRDWIASALFGFAALLMLAGERQRDVNRAPPTG